MKLKELLDNLTQNEWKELIKFSESPYFNTRKDIVLFLKKVLLSKSKEKPKSIESIFKDIDNQANEQETRLFFSYTKKVVERFLIQYNFDQSQELHSILLLRSLRHKKLHRQFEIKLQHSEDYLNKQPHRNASYYDQIYQLHQENYYNTVFKTRLTELPLQNMSNNLDYAYILNKIRLLCQIKSHLTVYKTEYHVFFEQQIIEAIQNGKLDDAPSIKAYYFAYQLFENQEDKSVFNSFLDHLKQHSSLFNHEELRELYLIPINYCIQQFNKGRRDYLETSLELYKIALENGFLLQDGLMSRFTFRNIIANSLSLRAFDWTENFINEYSQHLENEDKKGILAFNRARLYFEKNDYSKALEHLIDAEYKDTLLDLSSRILLVKIYYELKEAFAAISLIESSKIFVRRQLKIGYHRQGFINFLKFSLKLFDSQPIGKVEKEAIKTELLSESKLYEKNWLLEKFSQSSNPQL